MGLVSEIFTDEVLARLPGTMAIGHTRYSTTGDSALLNAQPISVESTKGLIAIAHNGNLVNLGNSKARLERDGALFQTTSDSEIIVQLIAHSRQSMLVDCIADSLAQVDGAFSIVMMTRNRIFAARDPHGFRPLSMGRIAGANGAPDTFVFASETCAFDLLHAKYERDVKPGELVMVSEDGLTSRKFRPRNLSRPPAASSSTSTSPAPTRASSAAGSSSPAKRWGANWRANPASQQISSSPSPTRASPRRSATPPNPASPSTSASSATTTSVAPSSSLSSALATSASA